MNLPNEVILSKFCQNWNILGVLPSVVNRLMGKQSVLITYTVFDQFAF